MIKDAQKTNKGAHMKRLMAIEDNKDAVVYDDSTWADGFAFYGIFFHEIIPAAELVFNASIA
jgi:hypothetical protein